MAKKTVVRQEDKEDVPTEVIASAILSISDGIRKLRSGRLNDRALFLLVQHCAPGPVPITSVRAVFAGIEGLEAAYLKKKPTK